MGKAKPKSKSDKNSKRKGPLLEPKIAKAIQKKPNPFDLRYNKLKKTTSVGQNPMNSLKKGSFVSGAPSIARSKSVERRKKVMTKLLGDASKNNIFDDRRIGAGSNCSIASKFGANFEKESLEDLIFKKMSLERRQEGKTKKTMSKFLEANRDDDDDPLGGGGLGDSVQLTHLGQSIAEIERFERPLTDFAGDEDDDKEESLFTRALANDDKHSSLKERMQKLIEVSKMNRAITKETNDRLKEQTESLDQDWKIVAQIVRTRTVGTDLKKSEKELEMDKSFGNLMEALEGSARAKPVDPEPDPDDIESKTQLKGTENDEVDVAALRSLMSLNDSRNPDLKPVPTGHVSADDLGEIFVTSIKSKKLASREMFEYSQEGKLIVPDEMKEKPILRRVRTDRRLSEEEDDEEDADDDDVASLGDLDVIEDNEGSENEDEEGSHGSKSGEESENEGLVDDDDNIELGSDAEPSDLESMNDRECDSELEDAEEYNVMNFGGLEKSNIDGEAMDTNKLGENETSESKTDGEFKTDLFQNDFADFFHHLCALFSEDKQKLEPYFKKLLETLFPRTDYKKSCGLLLNHLLKSVEKYLNSLQPSERMDIQFMSVLFSTIKSISQKNVETSHVLFRKLLLQKFQKIKTTSALNLDLFVFLVIVKNIYSFRKSTQDVLHSMICMTLCKVLTKCRVCSITDLRNYLLFVDLFVQITPNFTEVVKSTYFYSPEVIAGLQNVFRLATQDSSEQPIQIELKPGFLVSGLHFEGKAKYDWSELILSGMQMKQTPRTRFKLLAFAATILSKCMDRWKKLHCSSGMMQSLYHMIKSIVEPEKGSSGVHNALLLKEFNSFLECYSSLNDMEREPLKLVTPKPKPYAQLNPKMLEVLDENMLKGSAFGKQNEKRRKQRQLRRETRGAMKEVMKDSQFVQRTWLNEQIAKDRERKQKVKDIYHQLANQEGEVKKCKKAKYQLI